jgi:hypothetical protein
MSFDPYDPPMVRCDWCWAEYRNLFPDMTPNTHQGDGCAAMVYYDDGKWFARGYYGSYYYDGRLMHFAGRTPKGVGDPICDECLKSYEDSLMTIKQGIL